MTDLRHFGDWALITGGTSGIGEAVAGRLAATGFNLVLVARRAAELERCATALRAQHAVEVRTRALDVTQADFLSELTSLTDPLDIGVVIACAGGGDLDAFTDRPLANHVAVLQLNATASVVLLHHFARRFQGRPNRGAIMLFGSTMGLHGIPYGATYSAAKAAVIALGEAVNAELKDAGVYVTVVSPGPTATPLVVQNPDADLMSLPIKPMAVGAVADGALKALMRNEPHHVVGRLNRFMGNLVGRRILSRRASVGLWGALLKKALRPSASGALRPM